MEPKKSSDVPGWYRQQIGEPFPAGPHQGWKATRDKWMTDPENPAYAREFGGMIRELGARYDGDPDIELVDLSIVGAWGEGAGIELLTPATLESLLDSYLDSFHKTPLVLQPDDKRAITYAMSRAATSSPHAPPLGWRADCLGDMGFFSPTENEMTDEYPEAIIKLGLADAWKTAPVTLEACGVMQTWKNKGYDVQYIIDQAVKWHASSFNAKSSAVPPEWQTQVNAWLNRMGYRFVLRRFSYPSAIEANGKLSFTSWWENKGNAPAYRDYRLALRLKRNGASTILLTNSDIKNWLPGDNLYDDAVFVPSALEDGEYQVDLALVDPATNQPKIKLAIAGVKPDGWYPMGKIEVHAHELPAKDQPQSEPEKMKMNLACSNTQETVFVSSRKQECGLTTRDRRSFNSNESSEWETTAN